MPATAAWEGCGNSALMWRPEYITKKIPGPISRASEATACASTTSRPYWLALSLPRLEPRLAVG